AGGGGAGGSAGGRGAGGGGRGGGGARRGGAAPADAQQRVVVCLREVVGVDVDDHWHLSGSNVAERPQQGRTGAPAVGPFARGSPEMVTRGGHRRQARVAGDGDQAHAPRPSSRQNPAALRPWARAALMA